MNLADFIFAFIVVLTLAGALMTVIFKSIIYSMLGLVLTMFGIAGLYVYLNSAFLAMMQILIYVGAVTVLISFAIMTVGPMSKKPSEWTTLKRLVLALSAGLASLGIFGWAMWPVRWMPVETDRTILSVRDIGRHLFDRLVLPFEMISLLIVIAIIGAVMLSLISREGK